ncbi:MAG: C1 family peptidase [Oscillospiraceae bacterium]
MRVYNLTPQREDSRDAKLNQTMLGPIPMSVDLRPLCPPVFNQGELGSCTANAGVAARMMLTIVKTLLSRLFLYYKEREIEGTVSVDAGATMRTLCKALHKYGVSSEHLWPYNIENFAEKPSLAADINAMEYRILGYKAFDENGIADYVAQIRQYLATRHQPVLIGVLVYESFESEAAERTGYVPVPDTKTEKFLGGHALLIVGYDDEKQLFIVRNSWGVQWGAMGYGFMPYEFVTRKIAFDAWVLE